MIKVASYLHHLQGRVRELMLRSEDKVVLALTLVIGAIVGLVVVAFIVVTDSLTALLYPDGGARWRRLAIPIVATLGVGYVLYRFFPEVRGSGVPQTKAAIFARKGYISFRTVVGKFLCSVTTLSSGIALGREGPSIGRGVWGIVSLGQLESVTGQQSSETRVGGLLDARAFPHLHADHSLDLALERMGQSGFDLLPVVSRANINELEGIVTLSDVLRAFGLQEGRAALRDERKVPS